MVLSMILLDVLAFESVPWIVVYEEEEVASWPIHSVCYLVFAAPHCTVLPYNDSGGCGLTSVWYLIIASEVSSEPLQQAASVEMGSS